VADNFVLTVALALACLTWWVVMPLRAVLHERKLRSLATIQCEAPDRWPLVSVLVPANNEQDTLFDAMQSLLRVDYPNLEVVIIDDRSTDRTGAVAEQLAAADPRIRILHIDELPAGWLGKVHALHRGIEVCNGEWLLFTDADVELRRGTLRRALTTASTLFPSPRQS